MWIKTIICLPVSTVYVNQQYKVKKYRVIKDNGDHLKYVLNVLKIRIWKVCFSCSKNTA